MVRRAALAPAGRITQVFRVGAERQGAYDFLEHEQVSSEAVASALFESTALASAAHDRVLVALDGTSLRMVDVEGTKGFGHIGTFTKGAYGLKVVNALALSCRGTPIGLADQAWWSRHDQIDQHRHRLPEERESVHWRDAVVRIIKRYAEHAPATKLHFLVDREGDATYLIRLLLGSGHEFTVRSNATRKVAVGSRRCDLRRVLSQTRALTRMRVEVPAAAHRRARVAVLEIRASRLPIVWRDAYRKKKRTVAPLTVVWARECGARRSKIEWILFTNGEIRTAADARDAVRRYTLRWRVEDFHKTWKSGVCRIEDSQLRSPSAVIKWATILAAVATRTERLRRRFREEPDAPASIELDADEIEALVFLKSEGLSRPVSAKGLTISQATRWIADLGGYVGARGSGLPGATTIARGLERVLFTVGILARLRADGRIR
jgi:hypothetical protein